MNKQVQVNDSCLFKRIYTGSDSDILGVKNLG